ncbi:glycoside hydrolase family 16 protein [Imhoffiella purpurea]|uniref:Beta-glucanase n=1 Tax=Imhoffiella purpurea TaxID=1249627 RepID=W9VGL1_9GAMM|nr:glycoside hydrolase family 16 protein [Imhoffiella purpurea]EXJ16146.1 beta-glucanase [Imhoffiella purpurea]
MPRPGCANPSRHDLPMPISTPPKSLLAACLLVSAQASADWRLVWGDEFEYEGPPDEEKWNIENWPPRRVNNELQSYTDGPENVRVEDGTLVIEAHGDPDEEGVFTSARIHSQSMGASTYGRFEARIRFPDARGTWSAFWLMPTDPSLYGWNEEEGWYWPNCGEIDIVEHVGYEPEVVHASVHSKGAYFKNGNQRTDQIAIPDAADGYHLYAVEWFEDSMEFFVDDLSFFRVDNDGQGWEWWPFDHEFYVILNLAVGGSWGGRQGVDVDAFPQRMLVDYVRISEYEEPIE